MFVMETLFIYQISLYFHTIEYILSILCCVKQFQIQIQLQTKLYEKLFEHVLVALHSVYAFVHLFMFKPKTWL